MARRVYACFETDPDGPIHFLVANGKQWQIVAHDELRSSSGDEQVALVPGTEVTEHRVLLPTRSDREALKAARFAVEDDVASAIEGLHVAVSDPGESGLRSVFVCQKDVMEAWCARLSGMGWGGAIIVPDYTLLPDAPAVFSLPGRHLVQLGQHRLALDSALPSDVLQAVLDRAEEVPVQLSGPHVHDFEDSLEQLASVRDHTSALVDLRQGAFSPRRKLELGGLAEWRRVAALAAAAGVAWLASTLLETRALNERSAALRAEAQRLYGQGFPDEGRVPNPASRIREKLEQSSGSSLSFVDASALLYSAVADIDGASLSSIRYDRSSGRVQASIDYRRYGDDLRLAEILNRSGVTASLGDSRANGSAISGDLTLEPAT